MQHRLKRFALLALLVALTLTMAGCLEGCSLLDFLFERHTLTINIIGEGTTSPSGTRSFNDGSVVEITVSSSDPWEFFDWTGTNAGDIVKDGTKFKITMNEDKEITAFFTDTDDRFEFTLEEQHFMGAEGEAQDLTNNPPYPPGFPVRLRAIPTTETDAFLHWTTTAGADPREFFENYEDPETTYKVPEGPSAVRPYFTKRTEPTEPGTFQYTHEDFCTTVTGYVGVTEHYWDLSGLDTGETIDFFFHARNIPDRFKVYYGTWGELTKIFNSSWVSQNPAAFENPTMYPEGVQFHDWHENVIGVNWLGGWGTGGMYEAIISKEGGKDVLLIHVEGRDSGTVWDYKICPTP